MGGTDAYLESLGVDWRRVADGEWGLSLAVGGWPLHVGITERDGLLRLQAEVCGPGLVDPEVLLHRNRSLVLVRFASTRAGAVWVVADAPVALLDRALGGLVEAADDVRSGLGADGGG